MRQLLSLVAVAVMVSGVFAADGIKSGLKTGELVGPFYVTKSAGAEKDGHRREEDHAAVSGDHRAGEEVVYAVDDPNNCSHVRVHSSVKVSHCKIIREQTLVDKLQVIRVRQQPRNLLHFDHAAF